MPTPQTKLAALEKVLAGIESGIVNPSAMDTCSYRNDFTYLRCGVGILFNYAQIEDIKRRKLNFARVSDLASSIGRRNIEEVTGMSISDLMSMQAKHDISSTKAFREYVKSEIKEVRYEVNASKSG